MIEQAAKIGVGTAFYEALLWLAQRNPRAAGMMLTYPALNGIVLLLAEPSAIPAIASSVLLMPALNGVLWASYLAGYERLVQRGFTPAWTSALLMAAGAVVWIVIGGAITSRDLGVPAEAQALYWAAMTGLGLLLTFLLPPHRLPPAVPQMRQPLGALVAGHRARIAMFIAILGCIALVERLGGPPALLGVLAGLPLIAMFSLHSIASDGAVPPTARRAALAGMAGGVWLGPGVAVLFVAAVWRLLDLLAGVTSGTVYLLCGALVLLAGWSVCVLLILALARLLPATSAEAPRTP